MKEQIKNNKNIIYPIIIISVFCLIVLLRINFVMGSDDERYSMALNNQDFGLLRINNRVLVNVTAVLVEYCGIGFWRICNLIVCVCMFLYWIKIVLVLTESEANPYINIIFCSILFVVPVNVLSSGMFWVTGSFSYLWGVAGCLMYLYPFLCKASGKPCGNASIVLAILGGIYAGNLEQTSVVQTCFAAVILVFILFGQREKIGWKYWALYLVSIVSLIVLLLLPFNNNRSIGAITVYFPDWYMLSAVDKLYQGFINLYAHIVDKNAVLMSILTGLTFFHICRKKKDKFIKGIAIIPFVYFIMSAFIKIGVFNGATIELLYKFDIYKYEAISNKMQLIPFVAVTAVLLTEAYLLLVVFGRNIERLCAFLFYGAGFASALMLAFSPTIFASGNRIFFLLDMFLIVIIGLLLYQKRDCEAWERYGGSMAFGMCVIDLMICAKFCFLFQNSIFY